MRSRYSAYVLQLERYLLNTWHPSTRPASLNLTNDQNTKWLGLTIKNVETINDTEATVEFVARYKIGGNRAKRLHEISQFTLTDQWYYVSGDIN
jgi:SEC-C motif-containing protein